MHKPTLTLNVYESHEFIVNVNPRYEIILIALDMKSEKQH